MNSKTFKALALVLLAIPTGAIAAGTPAPLTGQPAASEHGKLAWFEGTYEEALAEAAKSKKMIFIDFWTDW